MENVSTASMLNLLATQPTFHLITGYRKRNWNAKECIHLKLSAIIVCHLLKLDMKSIRPAKTMSLTPKLCAINANLPMLLSKDRNTDMSTMCSLWISAKYKILWDIGSPEKINSKELDFYMGTMLKILTIKEVLESSLKHCMNQNSQVVLVVLKFYKTMRILI